MARLEPFNPHAILVPGTLDALPKHAFLDVIDPAWSGCDGRAPPQDFLTPRRRSDV